MKNVFIYALNCPVTGHTRYIGKAENPLIRYGHHLRSREKTHKARWIRSLPIPPILEILDEVSELNWQALEAAYIQFFREEGFDLTNSTDGGDGVTETPERRAAIGAAMRGKKRGKASAAHCAAIGASSRGRKVSLETRAKISTANLGRKFSPEHCAALSVASLGRKKSPGHCAKISAAGMGNKNRLGRRHSTETRAKISAVLLGKKDPDA